MTNTTNTKKFETITKTYSHKLTNEILSAVKISSEPCRVIEGEMRSGIIFKNEKGEERFLTNNQIAKLLK